MANIFQYIPQANRETHSQGTQGMDVHGFPGISLHSFWSSIRLAIAHVIKVIMHTVSVPFYF